MLPIMTSGPKRTAALAEVREIGTQFESIPASLASPIKLANAELGLPVEISVPESLNIRPGELVEISVLPIKN